LSWFIYTGTCYAGNEAIRYITSLKRHVLRVDLRDYEGNTSYAQYDNFTIGSAADKYQLVEIGSFSGPAGELHCSTMKW